MWSREGWVYRLQGRNNRLVFEYSLYDVCLYADKTGFMMSKSEIFGGNGCYGTDTPGTDAVSETTLGYGVEGGATTVDSGVNYDGNIG